MEIHKTAEVPPADWTTAVVMLVCPTTECHMERPSQFRRGPTVSASALICPCSRAMTSSSSESKFMHKGLVLSHYEVGLQELGVGRTIRKDGLSRHE